MLPTTEPKSTNDADFVLEVLFNDYFKSTDHTARIQYAKAMKIWLSMWIQRNA